MAEYRYTANLEVVEIIKEALMTCSYGIGFSILCDIKEIKGSTTSTLVFTTIDPDKDINPIEFFAFGIIIGRDYLTPFPIKKSIKKK